MEVSGPLTPLRGAAPGKAGLMLGINPASVAYVSSFWDERERQNALRLHLNNGRIVQVAESGADVVLEALGLSEFVGKWVLDLERDVG